MGEESPQPSGRRFPKVEGGFHDMTERRAFGLYVHWPFCQAKCPYCDFNSHVSAHIDQSAWADAYEREIARCAAETAGRILDSVFFGGGTPSLMSPETVDRILTAIRAAWPLSNDLEVTLEANPTSVEASRFEAYARLGVNRVSIGVQSLRETDLRRLGRLHSVEEAKKSVRLANEFFDRVSFDLIYARQNQTLSAWRDELSEALELAEGHLSLYQLTIEPGTAFGDRFARGKLSGLPEEDLAADMYELTQDLMEAAGLPAYEVSNHAAPGQESKHNLIYWRSHDWLGIGPGAHGRFDMCGERLATETYQSPRVWLNAVAEGNGESMRYALTKDDTATERTMMGLRLTEGLSHEAIKEYGKKISYL
jgi:oxygen-independent coproporphyrinogen-3 oxidase